MDGPKVEVVGMEEAIEKIILYEQKLREAKALADELAFLGDYY